MKTKLALNNRYKISFVDFHTLRAQDIENVVLDGLKVS